MYGKDVTMKSSPHLSYKTTLLRSPLISLKAEILNKNSEFGIWNGSEKALFVNSLCAYLKKTYYINMRQKINNFSHDLIFTFTS